MINTFFYKFYIFFINSEKIEMFEKLINCLQDTYMSPESDFQTQIF